MLLYGGRARARCAGGPCPAGLLAGVSGTGVWLLLLLMQFFTPRSTPGYSYRGGAFRAERTGGLLVDLLLSYMLIRRL